MTKMLSIMFVAVMSDWQNEPDVYEIPTENGTKFEDWLTSTGFGDVTTSDACGHADDLLDKASGMTTHWSPSKIALQEYLENQRQNGVILVDDDGCTRKYVRASKAEFEEWTKLLKLGLNNDDFEKKAREMFPNVKDWDYDKKRLLLRYDVEKPIAKAA